MLPMHACALSHVASCSCVSDAVLIVHLHILPALQHVFGCCLSIGCSDAAKRWHVLHCDAYQDMLCLLLPVIGVMGKFCTRLVRCGSCLALEVRADGCTDKLCVVMLCLQVPKVVGQDQR